MSRRSEKGRLPGDRSRQQRGEEASKPAGSADAAEVPIGSSRSRKAVGNVCAASAVCVFLLLAMAVVFGQTLCHDFVNFDDDGYVTKNPHVINGLTFDGIVWAMTARHSNNWHPLTWLSHMLDCNLYGLHAGGHHFSSVLLHAVTSVLLFLVLWRMTYDLWPSAFVAAVFAVHPLHVESVAWVAERKDVLSGLFFVLILAAYLHYVRRPFSLPRYMMVVVLFGLGLMAKPMLVTLPFVLLLLDYWPLGRIAFGAAEDSSEQVAGNADVPARARRLSLQPMSRLLAEKFPCSF